AVGIEVGAVGGVGADFTDAGEHLETDEEIRGVHAEAEAEQVAAGNSGLQLLGSAESDDAAVVNDGKAFTERVGFFHVVRGEKNRFAALVVFADDLPEEQTGGGVKGGAGRVEEWQMGLEQCGRGAGKP